MIKLTIIGAGSTVFTQNIISDLLLLKEFKNLEICLMDIDKERLEFSFKIANSIAKKLGLNNKITAQTDQKEALVNANFVITTFQVGGFKPSTLIDFEIPSKYGLNQTIGDTIGIGGIMRGLRTIPVLNSIGKDIMEVCPKALLLQYVNPMCINMIALNKKFPAIQTIGLCHSVQGTIELIAEDLKENIDDIIYECVGINHLAFYTRLEKKLSNGSKVDLYPALKIFGKKIISDEEVSSRTKKKDPDSNNFLHEKVRYEILDRFGYFVTESSEHFAEYVPWFIKNNNKNLIEEFKIPIGEYLDRCNNYENRRQVISKTETVINFPIKKSNEYASEIMKAVLTNQDFTFNANVQNDNLIQNLPKESVVEVPCLINTKGIKPKKIGKIPVQLAAIMQTNINVQLLTAEAALELDKGLIYNAAMLDPHTASELSIKQICNMVDDLLEAHKDYLPNYK